MNECEFYALHKYTYAHIFPSFTTKSKRKPEKYFYILFHSFLEILLCTGNFLYRIKTLFKVIKMPFIMYFAQSVRQNIRHVLIFVPNKKNTIFGPLNLNSLCHNKFYENEPIYMHNSLLLCIF